MSGLAIITTIALIARPRTARAARVGGTYYSYQGQLESRRDLHFDNCVTRDIYLSPTHTDGSFAAQLPPGCYNLRTETGAIVAYTVLVGEQDLNLGRVNEPAPLAPMRLFQLQGIFPSLLTSPAPSTAYVYTRDTTVLPPSALKVPVPTSESALLRLSRSGIEAQGDTSQSDASRGGASNVNAQSANDGPRSPGDALGTTVVGPDYSEPPLMPSLKAKTPMSASPQ